LAPLVSVADPHASLAAAEIIVTRSETYALPGEPVLTVGRLLDRAEGDDPDGDIVRYATKVIIDRGLQIPLARLRQALHCSDRWRARQHAAVLLGRMHRPEVLPDLLQALDDRDTDVQAAAVEALRQIGDRRALDPLIVVAKNTRHDPLRQAAIEALLALRP